MSWLAVILFKQKEDQRNVTLAVLCSAFPFWLPAPDNLDHIIAMDFRATYLTSEMRSIHRDFLLGPALQVGHVGYEALHIRGDGDLSEMPQLLELGVLGPPPNRDLFSFVNH